MKLYYKKYPHHFVIGLGARWLSVDVTGIMVWTGARNWFFIYKRPRTRITNLFHN